MDERVEDNKDPGTWRSSDNQGPHGQDSAAMMEDLEGDGATTCSIESWGWVNGIGGGDGNGLMLPFAKMIQVSMNS